MSALVDRAIHGASLDDVLEARRTGMVTAEQVERLRGADLLVLGALADRVRAEEVGDEVRIFTEPGRDPEPDVVVLPQAGQELTGLDLLREVALARMSGPRAARVRVDWTRCGLELAQIALGFGASELEGRIASKRGLPLAEGERLGVGKKSRMELAEIVKRKELEGFVRRAGRSPSFDQEVS
jgi:2-iminoacetate synthase ThiH